MTANSFMATANRAIARRLLPKSSPATDVASCGLDIDDISHVINYDFPRNIETYVHRVGSTSRTGRKGTSISFLTREDWAMAQPLTKIMQEAQQGAPQELLKTTESFNLMKQRRAGETDRRFGGGSRGLITIITEEDIIVNLVVD